MKISEMIQHLSQIKRQIGDTEVLITDGFDGRFYRGDYEVTMYEDDDGNMVADIGIGGCLE